MSIKPTTASCLAVIQAGFCGKELIETFEKLVLRILIINNHVYINVAHLCRDFEKEYGFSIPEFPMRSIIQSAIRSKWIVQEETTKRFRIDANRKDIGHLLSEIETKIAQFDKGVNDIYQSYIAYIGINYGIDYSKQDAEEHFCKFFNYGNKFVPKELVSIDVQLHLAKFVEYCHDYEPDIYNNITILNTGLLLVENVTFAEKRQSDVIFQNTKCFLDTNTILHLLGIDMIDRRNVYKGLLEDAKKAGLSLYVFPHTIAEITRLLEGAMVYIDSKDYDPSLATEAAHYFRENGYSRERINRLKISLISTLESHGIIKENVYFKKDEYGCSEDEAKIKEIIIKVYERNGSPFDQIRKSMTLEDDIDSIMKIYQIRNGYRTQSIYEVGAFLLTSSRSLVRASENYEHGLYDINVAACIYDEFLGTLLWYNNPVELTELSKVKLASRINASFRPSQEFYQKLMGVLKEIEADEVVNADAVYMLKSDTAIRRYVELTNGDVHCFDQKTVLQVYNEIKKEGGIELKQRLEKEVPEKLHVFKFLQKILLYRKWKLCD